MSTTSISSSNGTSTLPSTYHAAVVNAAGSAFEIKTLTLSKELKPNQVLLRVEACGLCHGDMFCVSGGYPGITYPRVPGHEVAGVVCQVGRDVKVFKQGDRAGRGWHGGHCFQCNACRRGDFLMCETHQITGFNSDGGYAEYMVCSWESLVHLPDTLPFEEAGPLLCAGKLRASLLIHCFEDS